MTRHQPYPPTLYLPYMQLVVAHGAECAQGQLDTGDRSKHLSLRPTCSCIACHTGVPVHATLGAEIAPEQLQAVLRGKPITSVTLHDSDVEYEVLLYHDLPLEQRVPALAASAPQLTAIPGLFLKELQDSPQPGLAGLSQLRALTLQQTPGDQQDLYGTALPSGLEALRLQAAAPYYCSSCPPTLIGFGRLHHLRRLTIAGYGLGALYTDEAVDGVLRIADLPPCLEVRAAFAFPLLRTLASVHRVCTQSEQTLNSQIWPFLMLLSIKPGSMLTP